LCLSRVRNQTLLASWEVQALSLHANANKIKFYEKTTTPHPLQSAHTAKESVFNLEGEKAEALRKVHK
jgi:hypothetical protein